MLKDQRSRRWQLTENNATYTREECVALLTSIGTAIYCIACSEVGESGTKHIHAFVVYENAISLNSLKRLFNRAHFEMCKGSNEENRAYIVKQDSEFFEQGSMPFVAGGKKEDVANEVVQLLMSGITLFEIMAEYTGYNDYIVKHYRSLREIETELSYKLPRKRR